MAVTFSLAPNPHWVVIDNFSKLPNGATIYTRSHLNPSEFKRAYQDAAGAIPYGDPIVGNGNGTFPPIFWEFDSDNTDDTYDIFVYDKENFPGNNAQLLWTFEGLSGGGAGGGGVITTNAELQNILINGQFYRNIGNQSGGSLPTSLTLAPSNHDGFCGAERNVGFDGLPSPDIIFAKSNATETDSILFVDFAAGDNWFGTTPTPQQYVQYQSNDSGSANYKYIQFPLVKGLQNLNNQNISVQMWNFLGGGSSNIKLSLRQFFGNGDNAPSADVVTDITALNLFPGEWKKTILSQFTVPSIGGKTIGNCGNDALFLQLRFPTSDEVNLSFILPAVYVGDVTSTIDFHTLDYVDSIANTPRTGDVRTSLNAFEPYGWVKMNDGTIGSATSQATARHNKDTFPLFDLLWRTFQGSATLQSYAPMRDVAGNVVSYGASSVADFTTSNRQITLTRNLGRVMAGALPAQTTEAFTTPVANKLTIASTVPFIIGAPVTVTVTGGTTPTAITTGATYYVNIPSGTELQLYYTALGAINADVTQLVTFVVGGVLGNVIFPAHPLGSFIGEETHLQTIAEMPAHTHDPLGPTNQFTGLTGGAGAFSAGGAHTDVATTGGVTGKPATTTRFNVLNPIVYMNVFMKL